MSNRYKGPRKRSHKDAEVEQKIICAATQGIVRAILDALLWWITKGGRF
jgi:hypothetical protein